MVAAETVGTNLWRASYSPRVAERKASMTSEGSALLNEAASEAIWTKPLDIPTEAFRVMSNWSKRLPKDAAPSRAAWVPSPRLVAPRLAQELIAREDFPKIVSDLEIVSLRSEASVAIRLSPEKIPPPI